MLTDRQQKFLNRMNSLSLSSSHVTSQERGFLNEARGKLIEGWDFKWVINTMNLELKEIDDGEVHLSPDAKALYQDLIEVYGEPDPDMKLPPDTKRPKDWRDADPDLVYTGTGKINGWRSRGGDPTGKSWWSSYFRSMLSFFFFFGNIWMLLFTPTIPWLYKHLGKREFRIVCSSYVVFFMSWLIISGRFRHRKNKSKNNKDK